jgi:outer membrane lipoprotein carrier protein
MIVLLGSTGNILLTTFRMGLLIAALIVTPLRAQEQPDRGRELVENFVNDVKTMSGRFEQQLVDADDVVLETSSGTVEIQRPGRFRWTYFEPYEQILMADGLNVWSYDVDLEQVTVKPQLEVLGSTPALLLGGSMNVLDEFEYVGSSSDRDTEWVELAPRTTENGFTKVELGFDEGQLSRMIFSDNLGQSTLIALFDVAVDIDIEEHRFTLALPTGVDLVGRPAKADAPALSEQ